MSGSPGRSGVRTAAVAAAAFLATTATFAGPDEGSGGPTAEDVKAKVLEVDSGLRRAEETLVRALGGGSSRDEAKRVSQDAGRSVAKLLDAVRDDGRKASAAMQWLMDNAPQ